MRISAAVALLLLACTALPSCKTSEENYRAAYEKTIQARREADSTDINIYADIPMKARVRTVDTPSGPFEVRTMLVRVVKDGGGIAENVKEYCGVVGQFKQIFNAKSMRERLVEAGYPSAFIVETSEPYYYVVLTSAGDINFVAEALSKLKIDTNFSMRPPCPFIIDRSQFKRPLPVMKRG